MLSAVVVAVGAAAAVVMRTWKKTFHIKSSCFSRKLMHFGFVVKEAVVVAMVAIIGAVVVVAAVSFCCNHDT